MLARFHFAVYIHFYGGNSTAIYFIKNTQLSNAYQPTPTSCQRYKLEKKFILALTTIIDHH